ncbi:hypothetical protein [Streptomyces cadmiisoli]|uniref:hypothetical protein n=1 Tax=Streptomyces cadmiisoli TaxID=2184053 RepID=UPI00364AAA07
MSTDQDGHGPEVELLRAVLLDRPVNLPAPPDRMAGVRTRYRRTRRRRVAATAVPLALLAAVFVPLQLGPGWTSDPADPPASAASQEDTSLENLYDLQVPVPPDWSELTVPSQRDGASSVRFISPDPLTPPEKSCPDFRADDWTDPACLPVSGVGSGALVAFQVETDPAAAAETGPVLEARAVDASAGCRSVSGTKMYEVQRSVGPRHPDAVLTGTACMGTLGAEARTNLMAILDKAVYLQR